MPENNRQVKEVKVAEIKGKLEKAKGVVFANYQGLTVEEDTLLRKNLREAGIEYKVYKNSLTNLAAKELGLDGISTFLEGPTSVALGYQDPTAPARVLNDFAKDHKKFALKAAIVEGEVYDTEKTLVLASIPPKDVLIGKLLGSLKAPLSKFVYLVSAISEKQQSLE
ncbi:MAG: 50S ribosomal protein L10 [Clostridiaceae bacterium]